MPLEARKLTKTTDKLQTLYQHVVRLHVVRIIRTCPPLCMKALFLKGFGAPHSKTDSKNGGFAKNSLRWQTNVTKRFNNGLAFETSKRAHNHVKTLVFQQFYDQTCCSHPSAVLATTTLFFALPYLPKRKTDRKNVFSVKS